MKNAEHQAACAHDEQLDPKHVMNAVAIYRQEQDPAAIKAYAQIYKLDLDCLLDSMMCVLARENLAQYFAKRSRPVLKAAK